MTLQVDVELAVREVLRQQMTHVHRERGLADPAHPGDRDQPGGRLVADDSGDQRRLAGPAGEVVDVGGELTRGGATPARPALARPGAHELLAVRPGQPEGADQQIHRDGLGETPVAAFQRSDGLLAELRLLGQRLLSESELDPMAAQKLPERAIHPDSPWHPIGVYRRGE